MAPLVEQRWSLWADRPYECDIEGRRTFALMQAAAFRSWFATGEIWAEIPWRERPGGRYGTKVRIIPPYRVLRRNNSLRNIVQGVRMNGDGMPVAYLATRKDILRDDQKIRGSGARRQRPGPCGPCL